MVRGQRIANDQRFGDLDCAGCHGAQACGRGEITASRSARKPESTVEQHHSDSSRNGLGGMGRAGFSHATYRLCQRLRHDDARLQCGRMAFYAELLALDCPH